MTNRARVNLALLVSAGLVLVGLAGPAGAQGILNTKHNLASGVGATPSGDIKTTGTNEVCVFCHTPHGADTAARAPLWNRAATAATFTMYSSPEDSLDAAQDATKLGISLACLSCHDGTVAFDALRNQPGSGGYNASAPSAGWTFAGGANVMPGGRITNIGTDLSNDHPISMKYSDARSPSASSESGTAGFQSTGTCDNSPNRTCVKNATLASEVPLFSGGAGDTSLRVQCATCHDPHKTTATFLRVGNNESKLCRTCHVKDG